MAIISASLNGKANQEKGKIHEALLLGMMMAYFLPSKSIPKA
jgi:hypothetical protein